MSNEQAYIDCVTSTCTCMMMYVAKVIKIFFCENVYGKQYEFLEKRFMIDSPIRVIAQIDFYELRMRIGNNSRGIGKRSVCV
jgi:hypothetical protein